MKVVLIFTLLTVLSWNYIVTGQEEEVFSAEDVDRIVGLCKNYCKPHPTKEGYTKPRRCANIRQVGPRDICEICRIDFDCVVQGSQVFSG